MNGWMMICQGAKPDVLPQTFSKDNNRFMNLSVSVLMH